MVFTQEQDAYLLMAHFRSGTRNADGSWSYSLQSCIDQFREAFREANIPYDYFARRRSVIQRFEAKHCICKDKPKGRSTVLTENVVEDIQHRIVVSPNKSVAKLSAQTNISVGTCHKALKKNLRMHPYKVTVVQELRPLDFEQRMRYCRWFNANLNNNELLDLTFFSDEAWFYLSGYVNSQNYRTWATDNPHSFEETSLHPVKVGVWVAMSRRRIIGPIFFYETVTAARYCNILEQFIQNLHDDELQQGYFQQDGATAHTAGRAMQYLQEFYDDRIISRGLWPARSPDLTPLDFYLFGRIKDNIYKNRMHDLHELENAIQQEINNISVEELQMVFENKKRRVNECSQVYGHHFQQRM